MSKTVLISGANGYFGGIACQYFQALGWQVLKATRGADADLVIDLDQPEALAQQRLSSRVDLFIHGAAAHEVTCREQPYRSIGQNVAGTRAALEFCLHNDIPKFVYLSTFHVFGNPQGVIDETSQPLPANDYGLSHLQAEDYVRLYRRQYALQGLVVRPSNFFGIPANIDRCNRWTLTPLAFCREAVEQGKIVLKTPGYQQRNFIAVKDLCAAIAAAVEQIEPYPLLHVAGPETLSIRALAQRVERVMNDLGQPVDLVLPEGEPLPEQFTFTSRYLSQLYRPSQTIDAFLSEFCSILSQRLVSTI
ncbi:MAG: NAD(P)-dependent oxidoreductase [Leptolyngbyaceae cyanobacterium SL_1_1]|nr:NAD(P)-dependent oxidoreductase [Leptolyngbyaceae cyanobacterium RM1_1_2]NJO08861.1 NAD(P)-dependent oxidoreductase [Leptolyngbyaceae cyanobacterium SL_1_1]